MGSEEPVTGGSTSLGASDGTSKPGAASLGTSGRGLSCQHADRWYPREVCWCGKAHAICSDCGAQIDPCASGRTPSRVPCPACGDRPLGFGCPEPQIHLYPERYAEVASGRTTSPRVRLVRALHFGRDGHGGIPFDRKDAWRQGYDAAMRVALHEFDAMTPPARTPSSDGEADRA